MIRNSEIRPLTTVYLPVLATVHQTAFPDSAISRLGSEATRRYYDWLLTGPHPEAFRVGLFIEDELIGYCFGGHFNGAVSGYLQRNRTFLFWQIATHPWLIFNPLFRERLQQGIRLFRFLRQPPSPPVIHWSELVQPYFGILAIATHRDWQGQGVGKQLMAVAETEARARQCRHMRLSVHPSNDRAIRFYESLAWQKEIQNGQWGGVMFKKLN